MQANTYGLFNKLKNMTNNYIFEFVTKWTLRPIYLLNSLCILGMQFHDLYIVSTVAFKMQLAFYSTLGLMMKIDNRLRTVARAKDRTEEFLFWLRGPADGGPLTHRMRSTAHARPFGFILKS